MKTKHICIQMIKYSEKSESEYTYIIRIDKYVTGNIVVTKESHRDTRKDEDYHKGIEHRGEEEFQKMIKYFKKEGYELL